MVNPWFWGSNPKKKNNMNDGKHLMNQQRVVEIEKQKMGQRKHLGTIYHKIPLIVRKDSQDLGVSR